MCLKVLSFQVMQSIVETRRHEAHFWIQRARKTALDFKNSVLTSAGAPGAAAEAYIQTTPSKLICHNVRQAELILFHSHAVAAIPGLSRLHRGELSHHRRHPRKALRAAARPSTQVVRMHV